MMVHDADAAVTLMSRWLTAENECEDLFALLREGQLRFTVERGFFSSPGDVSHSRVEFESLLFEDGSRALRLVESHEGGMTAWSTLAPLTSTVLHMGRPNLKQDRYDRPQSDPSHFLTD